MKTTIAWTLALALATGALVAAEAPQPAPKSRLGIEFVRIPAGDYTRGFHRENEFDAIHRYSNEAQEGREQPSHRVTITEPFDIARTEVTVDQFRAFVEATGYQTDAEKGGGAYAFKPEAEDWADRYQLDPEVNWRNPVIPQTRDHPVVAVSWNDAQAFCRWLSEQEGKTYRLPTEAEWEYAARAGGDDWYSWGTDPDEAYANANVADAALEAHFPGMVRFQRALRLEPGDGDGVIFTAPVASFPPSPWGLYDLHGNVWEWCQDRWSDDAYKIQLKGMSRREWHDVGLTDPLFDEKTSHHEYGDWRVMRGGAWNCAPANVRASIRTYLEAGDATVYTGFRLVREAE